MEKTIYFHIGSMKTGSTGIQKFLYENREQLLQANLDYVQFQPPQLHLPRWANADFLLNPEFDAEYVADTIERSPASKIVISEEGLISRPWVWQHPAFSRYNRKIILYLRNSVELVASWAAENSLPYNFRQTSHASGRGVVSIDEGIGIWTNAYRGMLFGLASAFSADPEPDIRIRKFPTEDNIYLIDDFLCQLDMTQDEIAQASNGQTNEIVNEGKDRKYCDIAYFVSQLAIEYGLESHYSRKLVDFIYNRTRSGDMRKVINSISNLEKHYITNRISTALAEFTDHYSATDGISTIPIAPPQSRGPYSRIDQHELRTIFLEEVIRSLDKNLKSPTT